MDQRPTNCRNYLRDHGKAYPRSGCAVCKTGGMTGCPHEDRVNTISDDPNVNPCSLLPPLPNGGLSPLHGVMLGDPPDLSGVIFVLVPQSSYVRDPVSGKVYIGPEAWAKLKGSVDETRSG